jgi:Tfp pilus assembly protein FimV
MIGLVLALPARLPALAVGDMVIRTPPGKSFVAEIPLRLDAQERARGVTVAFGDAKEYRAEKLIRPALVDTLEATVITGARDFIRISARQPLPPSSFDLVLLVRTGQVTIVRAYHMAVGASAPEASPVATPVVESARVETPRRRPAKSVPAPRPADQVEKTAAAPTGPAWSRNLPARYGPVQSGGTLYSIAEDLGVPRDGQWQAVVLLWQANKQEFFGGNMHGLRAGAHLTVPPNLADGIGELSRAEAQRLVAEQWEGWQTLRRTPGGLQQIGPPEKGSAVSTRKPLAPPEGPPLPGEAKLPPPLTAGASAQTAPAALAGSDMEALVQRMETLLAQRLPQADTPGGTVTFVSATELQGALQTLEERLLQRMQELRPAVAETARDTVLLTRWASPGEAPTLMEQWLPMHTMVYVLVVESTLLLLLGGGFLWRWYRSRT